MLTVLEAIKLSDEYLQKYGIDSPRLNAELLLAAIINCKRLDLYLLYDRPLNEVELKQYREFLKRRSKHEPLQYIIGYVEFYGLKFIVNTSTLIPRPETELLVENVLKNALQNRPLRLLDIGAGTGNICISLLKNLRAASAVGIDVLDETLKIAHLNSEANGVGERLELINLDVMKNNLGELGKFDLIISNPPYISFTDFDKLEPELRLHEPAVALTDYADGYSFFERIISISKDLLNPGGKLYFELGQHQHIKVKQLMESNGYLNINIVKDYSSIERIISGEV
jgi:release factor glutamine methyltransferase